MGALELVSRCRRQTGGGGVEQNNERKNVHAQK